MQAAQPQDPYRSMLRGSALPALPVVVVALVVATVLAGGRGAAGAGIGSLLVFASFGSSLVVMSRTARLAPSLVMAVALVTYLGKVLVLGVVLLLVQGADPSWLSRDALALTAVAVAVVWLAGEMWAFSHVRMLVFETSPATDTMTKS